MCRCCALTHSHKTAHSHRFSHHTRYLAAAAVCLPTRTPPADHYYSSLHTSDTTQGVSVPCLSVPPPPLLPLRRWLCLFSSSSNNNDNKLSCHCLFFGGDRFPQCVDAALSLTQHRTLTSLFSSHSISCCCGCSVPAHTHTTHRPLLLLAQI